MKNKALERTQQTIKRKWKIIEGKERIIVIIGLAIAYIVFLALIFVIYNSFQEKIVLEMKFESESSFNSVYMALTDSSSKALSVMEEEGVSAIGIYSSSGQLYTRLGDAPATIPLSKLVKARQKDQDSTLGIYLKDNETK